VIWGVPLAPPPPLLVLCELLEQADATNSAVDSAKPAVNAEEAFLLARILMASFLSVEILILGMGRSPGNETPDVVLFGPAHSGMARRMRRQAAVGYLFASPR